MYYTECSNLLGGIACLICAIAEALALRNGGNISRVARYVKYAAGCCLLMTLFVVTFVLAPMLHSAGYPGFYLMFVDGVKSVTHFGAPLLVTITYALFEADRSMTVRQSLIGLVPTLAYAAVAYPCNIARIWDGPYPFFQVHTMPIWAAIAWFIALLALSFGLCQLLRLASRSIEKSESKVP